MISVIVPVHNGEKTLQRCVDSILSSTEKDLELILVENGSSDRTLEICNAYAEKNKNIRVLIADVTGLSHARNLGMAAAWGAWIAFVDADDYVNPAMYELLLHKAKADRNDFVFGTLVLGENPAHKWEDREFCGRNVSVKEYCRNLFCTSQYMYSLVMNKLFSASLVRGLWFDESLRYAEDREFVFRVLSKVNTIGFVDTAVYYYFQANGASISKSVSAETRMDQVRSLQKCANFADEAFSAYPIYREYIDACLLQNADFRRRRAVECGLTSQAEELAGIVHDTAKRVRKAKYLDMETKYRFLLEHDAPGLFQALARLLKKG